MFDQLRPLMQNGERYIVVEDGRPEFVLMRFHDYASLARSPNPGRNPGRAPTNPEWERANAELEEVRESAPAIHTAGAPDLSPLAADPTTIRLEDLPL